MTTAFELTTSYVVRHVHHLFIKRASRESISANQSRAFLEYWHQRADERHGNPPQGNQEPLVVRVKVGRPPGELGVSKYVDCDTLSLQCFHLLVWRQEGHLACKKLGVGLLMVMI